MNPNKEIRVIVEINEPYMKQTGCYNNINYFTCTFNPSHVVAIDIDHNKLKEDQYPTALHYWKVKCPHCYKELGYPYNAAIPKFSMTALIEEIDSKVKPVKKVNTTTKKKSKTSSNRVKSSNKNKQQCINCTYLQKSRKLPEFGTCKVDGGGVRFTDGPNCKNYKLKVKKTKPDLALTPTTSLYEMIPFGALPCALKVFKINGQYADTDDFGHGSDINSEIAEPYGCGDHQFILTEHTQESLKKILTKYDITEDEYNIISRELVHVLDVGSCGWCI